MKILSQEDVPQLNYLASLEADIINLGFKHSKNYGLVLLSNTLANFKDNYLKRVYGDIIPSMSSEYRVFVVELLKLIDDKYKEIVLSELLIPKVREINDEELLKILNGNHE